MPPTKQGRECVGSVYGQHVPSKTRKGVSGVTCAACDQPMTLTQQYRFALAESRRKHPAIAP